jgi:serine/threonine protein kinase/WD40 repeat protein
LARHPDLASALAGYLDALEFVQAAATDLRGPESVATNGSPPAVAGLGPGDILGDFRILRAIGQGGMGTVYEAEQLTLRRRVALKVLPFAAVADSRHLQRFKVEAQAAACLHHPNIVPVHAVGLDRGIHFFAMQLIDGQTLAGHIQALRLQAGLAHLPEGDPGPRVSATAIGEPAATPVEVRRIERDSSTRSPHQARAHFRTVASLGIQAALALDHAHQQGVIHRDVKPGNLLLDAVGKVWITDFGLAQFQGDPGLTATGVMVGTLRYMSPEQALGQRRFVDQRTDIFSLGATLYELLTLEPAFPGQTQAGILLQIGAAEPAPPRRLNRAIPADLETIVLKALARDPEERYATARDLADDLKCFLEDRPVMARRPGHLLRLRKWAWRRRSLLASLAASLALVLVGLVVVMAAYALQQQELAGQQAEDARNQEKARLSAERKLYHALLAEAASFRLARLPGYRRQVLGNLRDAIALDIPEADKEPDAVRAQIVACLGDPIGLDPVPPAQARRMPPVRLPDRFAKFLAKAPAEETRILAADPKGHYLACIGRRDQRGLNLDPNYLSLIHSHGGMGSQKSPAGAIYDLKFTPDGRFLVAGCEMGVVAWQVPMLSQTSFVGAGNIHSVAIDPGGRLLATAGRQIELWSLFTNRLIASFPTPLLGLKVEFSADGNLLLGVSQGKVVNAWPVSSTPEKRVLEGHIASELVLDGHPLGVPAIAFSSDGLVLASASKDGLVHLWAVNSGKKLQSFRGRLSIQGPVPLEAVAFSPNGDLLATGDVMGGVSLWDLKSGREVVQEAPPFGPPGQVWRLTFDHSGKYLAAGGGRGLAVWQVSKTPGGVLLRPAVMASGPGKAPGVYDLDVHPGGRDLVFLDQTGRLYHQKMPSAEVPLPLNAPSKVQLRSLHFDRDGRRLTFVGNNDKLGVWDWANGTSRITDQQAFLVSLEASGRWVAATLSKQGVVVYDLVNDRKFLTLPPEISDVWSLAWSPGGTQLAAGLADGTVVIWDLARVGEVLAAFQDAVPFCPSAGGS